MKRLIVILALLLTLCACSYTEPDAVFTVTELGIIGQGQEVKLILKINESDRSFSVFGKGDSLSSALKDAKTKLTKKASFQHLGLIAFSENLEGQQLNDALSFCKEKGAPLRTRIAYIKELEEVFEDDNNIISLLKQSDREFGFGGNTTLFEIETAILVSGGDFALPFIEDSGEGIRLCGLLRYKNSTPYKRLNLEQSAEYKKEVLG